MIELNSYGNMMNKLGANDEGLRLSRTLINGSSGIGYGQILTRYDNLKADNGGSNLNIRMFDGGLDNPVNEGMIVNLVRALTSSLAGVIDLFKGALLGDSPNNLGSSLMPSSGDAGKVVDQSRTSQGLFSSLGSIAGNLVDKIFVQIPLLGGRGF